MKKLKRIRVIALLGIISYCIFSGYSYITINKSEHILLENVEALSQLENETILIQGYATRYVLVEKNGSYTFFTDCCMPSANTDYCNYGVVRCKNGKLD